MLRFPLIAMARLDFPYILDITNYWVKLQFSFAEISHFLAHIVLVDTIFAKFSEF